MGRNSHAIGLRQPGDLDHLQNAAGAHDVGVEDVGRLFVENSPEMVHADLALARDDRRVDLAPHVRHLVEALARDGLLEPEGIEGREGERGFHRKPGIVQGPGVDQQARIVADRLAHPTDALRRLVEGRVLHRVDLQRIEPASPGLEATLHEAVDRLVLPLRIHVGVERHRAPDDGFQ